MILASQFLAVTSGDNYHYLLPLCVTASRTGAGGGQAGHRAAPQEGDGGHQETAGGEKGEAGSTGDRVPGEEGGVHADTR